MQQAAPAISALNRFETYQIGFTLIEALVAIVIVSIGLIGLIGLQTTSLQNTQISAAATQASIAADSMADRMRSNNKGVLNNKYDKLNTDSIASSTDCKSISYTGKKENVSQYDLKQWYCNLKTALPKPVGSVTRTSKGSIYRFRITISWHPHHAKGYLNLASITKKNNKYARRCSSKTKHCLTRRVTIYPYGACHDNGIHKGKGSPFPDCHKSK